MFQFACRHTLRRRRSRCKGTKHKKTRTSIKAACTAESFLTIVVRVDCGPCQYASWEHEWMLKLERAKSFKQKFKKYGLPGVEIITNLVEELENDYSSALWSSRNMFAQTPRSSVPRVPISEYRKTPSPLSNEVHSEDIVEATRNKIWTEMDVNEYDCNYIAITNPTSTDCSHPLDDDDGSWALDYLSSEKKEYPSENIELDFHASGWNWGDDVPHQKTVTVTSTSNNESPCLITCDWQDVKAAITEHSFTAWGPNVEATSSTAQLSMKQRSEVDTQSEHVQEVVKAFWNIVHDGGIERKFAHPRLPDNEARNDAHDNLCSSDNLWMSCNDSL